METTMRRRFLIASAFFLLPVSAMALDNNEELRLNLPHGEVIIGINQVEGEGLVIHAGGDKELLMDSAYMPEVMTTYEDSVLLQLAMGGNACPATYVWLTYDGKDLRSSKEFGTCQEGGELKKTDGFPAFIMDDGDSDTQQIRYDYDGKTIKETKLTR
jgi:hypothetical protein